MGNNCYNFTGQNCTWYFERQCNFVACKNDDYIWRTWQLCSKHCCNIQTYNFSQAYKCEHQAERARALVLGLSLGLGIPGYLLLGCFTVWIFDQTKVCQKSMYSILIFLLWPLCLVGLLFFLIGRLLGVNFNLPRCCNDLNIRLLCVIPASIFFFIVTILGYLLDLIFIVLSVGIVLCRQNHQFIGNKVFQVWKQWINGLF